MVKLVHLVGFIIKKFVTMHSHMNVKKSPVITLHTIRFHNSIYTFCPKGVLP